MAEDLYSSAHFEVRVNTGRRDQTRVLGLCRVGPISSETRESETGGRPAAVWAPVVLTRALTADRYLFDWRRTVAGGKSDVRTVTLRLAAAGEGDRAIELRLEGCRPTRWTGPRLDAIAGGVACEEIELVYDRVIWV